MERAVPVGDAGVDEEAAGEMGTALAQGLTIFEDGLGRRGSRHLSHSENLFAATALMVPEIRYHRGGRLGGYRLYAAGES